MVFLSKSLTYYHACGFYYAHVYCHCGDIRIIHSEVWLVNGYFTCEISYLIGSEV